jgi:hypothetical protein
VHNVVWILECGYYSVDKVVWIFLCGFYSLDIVLWISHSMF